MLFNGITINQIMGINVDKAAIQLFQGYVELGFALSTDERSHQLAPAPSMFSVNWSDQNTLDEQITAPASNAALDDLIQ